MDNDKGATQGIDEDNDYRLALGRHDTHPPREESFGKLYFPLFFPFFHFCGMRQPGLVSV